MYYCQIINKIIISVKISIGVAFYDNDDYLCNEIN